MAFRRLQNGAPLEGKNGVLGPLIKRLIEAGLNGEMDAHLTGSPPCNSVILRVTLCNNSFNRLSDLN